VTAQPSLFDDLDTGDLETDTHTLPETSPQTAAHSHIPTGPTVDDRTIDDPMDECVEVEPNLHPALRHPTLRHPTTDETADPPPMTTDESSPRQRKTGPRTGKRSDAGTPLPFTVEVVRSKRRKRTVGAQIVGGVLRVTVPSWMSRSEEQEWVREMSRRYERAHHVGRIDLTTRAAALARRFNLPKPADIRWGGDMRTQWGSCTPVDRTIRLSDRLADMPPWVLDYVLVHEMAHITEPNHSAAFWKIVHRYDKAERAIGYLLAKSIEPSDASDFDDDLHHPPATGR
jgi:hypothetical protein